MDPEFLHHMTDQIYIQHANEITKIAPKTHPNTVITPDKQATELATATLIDILQRGLNHREPRQSDINNYQYIH